MSDVKLTLVRDVMSRTETLGRLFVDGVLFGYTCEDPDRKLEEGGVKIKGQTAIPRGMYLLTVTMSNRFKRLMPLIQGVHGFEGIRIHGGNTASDTEGCPLLGQTRTAVGVQNCKQVNEDLIALIQKHESQGNTCWIEVR